MTDSQAITAMDSCGQMLAARYDDKLGGFGAAPKFPRPSELNLLLVQHLRTKAAGSRVESSETSILQPPSCSTASQKGTHMLTFVSWGPSNNDSA